MLDTMNEMNDSALATTVPRARCERPAVARRVPVFFTALGGRRAWLELAYALVALPVGIGGFVFTVVTVSVSGGMVAVALVGIPTLAATGLASRWLGYHWRLAANSWLGWAIDAPEPFRGDPGFLGWIRSCLADGTAWRSRLYFVLKLPLGIASFVTATVLYAIGAWGLTYWFWYRWLPCRADSEGVHCQRNTGLWNGAHLDSVPTMLLLVLIGIVALLIAPWAVRAILALDRLAMQALLGPSSASRVAELEHSRAHAVDDAAATLRRIERDLHDGTQARLVALAMNIGLAKEKIAEGTAESAGSTGSDDAARTDALTLLDRAHATAKDAIAEVRDLARGIHPPVLDAGLDVALGTLAAHSAVPVRVHTAIDPRPTPSIETIAYFCAAELMTNIAKHSHAGHGTVDVRTVGDRLRLQVADDGVGGASMRAGGGLAGLRERIRTVDGRLTVDSPPGGPTTITVELPLAAESTPRQDPQPADRGSVDRGPVA